MGVGHINDEDAARIHTLRKRTIKFIKANNTPAALKTSAALIRINLLDIQSWTLRFQVLKSLQDPPRFIKFLERAVRRFPDNSRFFLNLLQEHYNANDFERVFELLESYARHDAMRGQKKYWYIFYKIIEPQILTPKHADDLLATIGDITHLNETCRPYAYFVSFYLQLKKGDNEAADKLALNGLRLLYKEDIFDTVLDQAMSSGNDTLIKDIKVVKRDHIKGRLSNNVVAEVQAILSRDHNINRSKWPSSTASFVKSLWASIPNQSQTFEDWHEDVARGHRARRILTDWVVSKSGKMWDDFPSFLNPFDLETVLAAKHSGQGVILVSSHLGPTPICMKALRDSGLTNQYLGNGKTDIREDTEEISLTKGKYKAVRQLLRHLKKGQVVGIAMDGTAQDEKAQMMIEIADHPISITTIAARLSMVTGAPSFWVQGLWDHNNKVNIIAKPLPIWDRKDAQADYLNKWAASVRESVIEALYSHPYNATRWLRRKKLL